MKTIIALGLVILSFLLVMALRHTAASLYSVPKGKPASAESQQIFRISHTLRVTPQAQPVHAILLAVIEAETDPDRRSEALERAVKSVSDADLPAMLDSLSHDNSPAAAELSQLLVRRWAETNAPAAAAWATQLPESSARRDALEQVAIAWANTDLPAAASWVHTLSEGDSKQAATLDLSYEATRTEPIAAIELVRTLPPTSERNDLLVHAISQWAGADSTTAAAWATKVSDPNLRERLVAAVAVASAKQDGAAAATLAVNSLNAGDEQDRTVVSVVQRWVQNSPQTAAFWVSQFPDIPLRNAAVQNLLAIWTVQDAEAAGNWLRDLPVGSLRDVGIAAYTQMVPEPRQ